MMGAGPCTFTDTPVCIATVIDHLRHRYAVPLASTYSATPTLNQPQLLLYPLQSPHFRFIHSFIIRQQFTAYLRNIDI